LLWLGGVPSLVGELSLTEGRAVELALQNRPELQAARAVIAEAAARARASGRLQNPEFQSELGLGPVSDGKVELALMQRFPLTARLRRERELCALRIEMARLELAEQEWLLAAAVRRGVVRLAAAEAAVEEARHHESLATEFAESLKEQVARGLRSSLDEREANLTVEEHKQLTRQAELEVLEATGTLAVLLGLAEGEAESIRSGTTLSLPAAVPPARQVGNRPDLLLAERAVAAGEAEVALARASRWDDVGVGVFAEGERLAEDDGNFINEGLLGIRVSIPLPIWQNGKAEIEAGEAIEAQAQARLRALRLRAEAEAGKAYRVMKESLSAARLTETKLLRAARKQVEETEAAYARGEADLERLFRAREQLAGAEESAIAARLNYHFARLEWERAVGTEVTGK